MAVRLKHNPLKTLNTFPFNAPNAFGDLCNVFEVICVPTLTREIIAGLGSAQRRSQRSTAKQRVQNLARRMSTMPTVGGLF